MLRRSGVHPLTAIVDRKAEMMLATLLHGITGVFQLPSAGKLANDFGKSGVN
jgi:hypothetical protein